MNPPLQNNSNLNTNPRENLASLGVVRGVPVFISEFRGIPTIPFRRLPPFLKSGVLRTDPARRPLDRVFSERTIREIWGLADGL